MTDLSKLAERLINQIEGCGFTDELGHKLEMNQAYIDFKAALQTEWTLGDVLEAAHRPEVGRRYSETTLTIGEPQLTSEAKEEGFLTYSQAGLTKPTETI